MIRAANEPLLHAMIELAGHCAGRGSRSNTREVRAFAKQLAREHRLDHRERDTLLNVAARFTAPLEVIAEDDELILRELAVPHLIDGHAASSVVQPTASSSGFTTLAAASATGRVGSRRVGWPLYAGILGAALTGSIVVMLAMVSGPDATSSRVSTGPAVSAVVAPTRAPAGELTDVEPSRAWATAPDADAAATRDDIVSLSRFGFFSISANARTQIYIDNMKIGDTPLTRLPLPPGRHAIRAVGPRGKIKTLSIMIYGGRDTDEGSINW